MKNKKVKCPNCGKEMNKLSIWATNEKFFLLWVERNQVQTCQKCKSVFDVAYLPETQKNQAVSLTTS